MLESCLTDKGSLHVTVQDFFSLFYKSVQIYCWLLLNLSYVSESMPAYNKVVF